uniref:Uncharacterized protein n=1 Tax=Daphnia galeata TaxID=27404 RepID=A0A8J2S003_9CRUS|nr:unnamed protein product [Daphnia galeata]
MQGLSLKSLKKHPSLIPLFVSLGAGVAMAALYTLRLATQNPDVTWDRKNNPEPWQKYAEKQYKFYVPSGFKPSQAPKFEE